jgi:hypothetical protein
MKITIDNIRTMNGFSLTRIIEIFGKKKIKVQIRSDYLP